MRRTAVYFWDTGTDECALAVLHFSHDFVFAGEDGCIYRVHRRDIAATLVVAVVGATQPSQLIATSMRSASELI